jgi:hypothetical protein
MRQFFLAIDFLFSACCQGLSQTQTAFDLRGRPRPSMSIGRVQEDPSSCPVAISAGLGSHEASFFRASIAARAGLQAGFAFPILLGKEVLGVVELFSREIRHPDKELFKTMATIGSQFGQFIERNPHGRATERADGHVSSPHVSKGCSPPQSLTGL